MKSQHNSALVNRLHNKLTALEKELIINQDDLGNAMDRGDADAYTNLHGRSLEIREEYQKIILRLNNMA
jgi:hypothetical protein